MKLSIVIAHYLPENFTNINPLYKTLDILEKQSKKHKIEVIIADDGSLYTKDILENYSGKIKIPKDKRDIYYLKNRKLEILKTSIGIKSTLIKKWVYLPKLKQCMSKARVTNYAVNLAESENLFLLDDDNYFITDDSIAKITNLFNRYDFIVGQIKDNNNKLRNFKSNRVQGTTIGIKKKIFQDINGLGVWTEDFSCGIDSDLWMKVFKYLQENKNLRACYTNEFSTYDSYSKRWKKFTKLLQDFKLKKEFNRQYNCKNYKSAKHNHSRKKHLWMDNLIE